MSLSYQQDGIVTVEALPRAVVVGVGGAIRTVTPRAPVIGQFLAAV